MPKLRLISFDICPYVHRSTIALEEKGIEYDLEFIDLSDKPDWFLAISPRGKVPLLEVDGEVLFESTAILEYLDETQAPRLHPEDPIARAKDRAWFAILDGLTGVVYKLMVAQNRAALDDNAGKSRAAMAKLEDELVGPLWHGERLSAVDAVAYPALIRLRWIDEAYPELELFAATLKVRAWVDTLAARPAIQRAAVPDLRERFVAAIKRVP